MPGNLHPGKPGGHHAGKGVALAGIAGTPPAAGVAADPGLLYAKYPWFTILAVPTSPLGPKKEATKRVVGSDQSQYGMVTPAT